MIPVLIRPCFSRAFKLTGGVAMGLSLVNIDKTVGQEIHLKDINLTFEPGSRNVILGRTLAGKTSLLRIMAGLDRPTKGKIIADGKDVTGLPVRKRKIAMVYQQFINYPSLTVYDNIASPLKIANASKSETDKKVREAAAMLHLEDLLDRMPSELSGGQQQRTAIARALVKDSSLLLMDEPLVNLDYKLREELREELRDIFRRKKAIVVYTTTEPSEALMLGGNIVVIDEGRVLQTGPTPKVYHNPASIKVAQIFSDPPINHLEGKIENNMAVIDENLTWPLKDSAKKLKPGKYFFGIRANHLFLSPSEKRTVKITGRVELSEINGSETFIHVNYAEKRIVVQEPGVHSRQIKSNITIYAHPGSFFIFDEKGELAASPSQSEKI